MDHVDEHQEPEHRPGAYEEAVESRTAPLTSLLWLKDRDTGIHSEGVRDLARRVALHFALSSPEIAAIEAAARMHDLGKMVLPDRVIHKPGPLSLDERGIIESHPLHSHEVLRKTEGFGPVAEIVLYHHERYDGTGYPARLEGWDIPIGARIIAAVDAFDAMRSERPYRRALSARNALEELIVGKGAQFDPEVVDVLLKVLKFGLH